MSIDTIDLMMAIMQNKSMMINNIPTIFNNLFFNSNF